MIRSLFALSLLLGLLVLGCKKETIPPDEDPIVMPGDSLSTSSAVKVTDTTAVNLLSTDAEIANGTIIYEYGSTPAPLSAGDVIIDTRGDGLLLKVVSSTVSGNTVTYQTVQANLTDVFNTAHVTTSSPINKAPWSVDLSGMTVYTSPELDITLTSGNVTFDPNTVLDFDIDDGQVMNLDFKVENAPLTANATFETTFNGSATVIDIDTTIASLKKKQIFMVGWVPIVITYEAQLNAAVKLDLSSAVTFTTQCGYDNAITTSISYDRAMGWDNSFSATGGNFSFERDLSISFGLALDMSLTPKIQAALYGVDGPYMSASSYMDYDKHKDAPGNWDDRMELGLDGAAGISVEIFDETLLDYSITGPLMSPWVYTSPTSIALHGGNNQTPSPNTQLPAPLEVKVFDSEGVALPNSRVTWAITGGNGSLSSAASISDINGVAAVSLTTGNDGLDKVEAKIFDGQGNQLGTGVEFDFTNPVQAFDWNMCCTEALPCWSCPSVSDGMILLTAQGGTRPYAFSINGGSSWQVAPLANDGVDFNNLPQGSYNCMAYDNASGTTHDTIQINLVVQ